MHQRKPRQVNILEVAVLKNLNVKLEIVSVPSVRNCNFNRKLKKGVSPNLRFRVCVQTFGEHCFSMSYF